MLVRNVCGQDVLHIQKESLSGKQRKEACYEHLLPVNLGGVKEDTWRMWEIVRHFLPAVIRFLFAHPVLLGESSEAGRLFPLAHGLIVTKKNSRSYPIDRWQVHRLKMIFLLLSLFLPL
jgi:hypothetical protein